MPGPGTDTLQKIHVTPDGTGQAFVIFSLQWDQPFLSSTTYAQATDPNGAAPRGATGDLDMLIYTDKGVLVPRCPPGVSTGITCQLVGHTQRRRRRSRSDAAVRRRAEVEDQ